MTKATMQKERERVDSVDEAVERHVHAGIATQQEIHWLIRNVIGGLVVLVLLAVLAFFQQPSPAAAPYQGCEIPTEQDQSGVPYLPEQFVEQPEERETYADPSPTDTQSDPDPPESHKRRPAPNEAYI